MHRLRTTLFIALAWLTAVGLGACDDDDTADTDDSNTDAGDTTGGEGEEACDAYEAHITECLGEAQGDILRQECDGAFDAGEDSGPDCIAALDAFFTCLSTRTCEAITELEPCVDEDQMVDATCG